MSNQFSKISSRFLLDRLWTFDDPPQEDSVKAHIKGLRKKLKQAGAIDWIENVYGIGYRFNPKITPKESAITEVTNSIPSSIEVEFEQKMEQMWQQYRGLMGERIKVWQTAVLALDKGDLTPELHESVAKAAHKLAGVLGMFDRHK